ncbi:four helix bundle protein [Sphingobacterium faecale]|uniref:Four helix bundle protein n=1 Tax=Sphingobacterium faecale TaxID=2803775 RepID=A0ABS1R6M2_9SPHI|nr:four helix bundle protein [Sphingobacterium faecale]MBL1410333.1 four helix bundle protein [Sphingobacterium faecale]
MKTHKNLDSWKFSVDLVTIIYQLTSAFPKEEVFGLTNQMRRASVSIPSNIAEGAARHSKKEFIQFLYIALGSQQELDTQLLIAKNLKFILDEDFDRLENEIQTIGKLLNGLIKYLKGND